MNGWKPNHPILYSVGLAVGICSVFISIKARSTQYQKLLATIVIVLYATLSCYVFWAGVSYICEILVSNKNYTQITTSWTSLGWIAVMIIFHLLMNRWTHGKKKQGVSMRFTSQAFKADNLGSIIV